MKDFMLRKLPQKLAKIYINLPIFDNLGTFFYSRKKIEKLLNVLGCDFEVINENEIEKAERIKNSKILFICKKR